MINIQLLESHDEISPGDFMRPLRRSADYASHSDAWMETSAYGGTPLDHLKWCPVRFHLGACWVGKTVGSFTEATYMPYEFVRGPLPQGHIMDTRELRPLF